MACFAATRMKAGTKRPLTPELKVKVQCGRALASPMGGGLNGNQG